MQPGTPAAIADRDPRDTLGFAAKNEAKERLDELHLRLQLLQQRPNAESSRSVLTVLQGLDTSGKNGLSGSVFRGLNPQSCRMASSQAPAPTEPAHDYHRRVHAALPARGEIGIFDRSHYEDIVTVRVQALASEAVWGRRSEHVREFERMLVDEGTTLVQVFLNLSKEEQRVRLQERIDDPEKRWKFRRADLETRALSTSTSWPYEEAMTQTSTHWAPWHVVPADRNWVKSTALARCLSAFGA